MPIGVRLWGEDSASGTTAIETLGTCACPSAIKSNKKTRSTFWCRPCLNSALRDNKATILHETILKSFRSDGESFGFSTELAPRCLSSFVDDEAVPTAVAKPESVVAAVEFQLAATCAAVEGGSSIAID